MKKENLLEALRPLLMQGKAFSLEDAGKLLQVEQNKVSQELSKLYKADIIVPIKRGVYLPVSSRFLKGEEFLGDYAMFIPSIFPDAYIGGWSALSHHGLTEQLFRDICLFVPKPLFKKARVVHNHKFILFTRNSDLSWGIDIVWVENNKLLVSDMERTIIDIFMRPESGGGLRHSIDCLKEYLNHHQNIPKLIDHLKKIDNGSLFKRLGFVSEAILGEGHELTLFCKRHITKGYIKIQNNIQCSRLITKWNLFIYENLKI